MLKRRNIMAFKFLLICIAFFSNAISAFSQWDPTHKIGTVNGIYNFSYNQKPTQLVELFPAGSPNTGLTYQWEQSNAPTAGFALAPNTNNLSYYNFLAPLAQTTYYRRKSTNSSGQFIYSNIIKISVVSVNWEDINYVREHDVLSAGITTWQAVDQLAIGSKLQTTTYVDGLGRSVEKVSRETATPAPGNAWGDMVQFSRYDAYGREPLNYLPYTTASEPGKFKTAPLTEQPQYFSTVYSETSAYSQVSFDNSPLNRVDNMKSAGKAWAASAGNTQVYELNDLTDNVQIFKIGYSTGDAPIRIGTYPEKTLFKSKHIDVNNKQVIEYTNKSGQVILTKTQVDDAPSAAHAGWSCVYSIYDDFGLLRYRIQPQAVKYLDENGWSFDTAAGQNVLLEMCFRYEYDNKGRNTLKKAPGAKELRMMYDKRDRVVFMQDGNQSAKAPNAEWTANVYDELDRLMITTLYRPAKTTAQLQADIDNAITLTSVTVSNPNQPVTGLVVDNRVAGTLLYTAQNSIEFVDGFSSITNDAFETQIDPTASKSISVTKVTYTNPISNTDLNDAAKNTVVKYLFYDDYAYTGAKTFDKKFDNSLAYNNTDPNVIPIAATNRTASFPTGSMVRVLGTNTFLTSTEYYDEKGRHIQSIEDNIKSGKDVTTLQYHWDGRLLSSHTKHTTANSGYANFSILTKNLYDKIGRVTSVMKKYGSNAFTTMAAYDLDDMGRLKTKHLDPGYTGTGKTELESLAYSYNIQNNITGINKDYALKTSGKYDKWANFFGLYLGYDNRDQVFNAAQLDGHVTGLLWNTQGDDAQRKYDYTYDNGGRLSRADFKEKQTTASAWDNSKMDFTVGGSGNGGIIGYDLNGNLLSMLQKGVIPGGTAPVTIDDLHYYYAANSNKLTKVVENSPLTTNGLFGDFKDGVNSGDDYVYDDNGNLVIDLNKNATNVTGGVSTALGTSGIKYNFLDKPEVIHIAGKGTIQIVYDADGNKLQKKYTPENSATSSITTYINEFVYQQTSSASGDGPLKLAYINFEEGRIRVVTPVSQSNNFDGLAIDGNIDLPVAGSGLEGSRGTYDYFVRDYQQNVRMILTEETHSGSNRCTMEVSRAGSEEPVFGQPGANNEVAQTRFDKPAGWQSNTSSSVSKLNALTKKTGPNVLLKVMAGDQLSAVTQYYYQNTVTNTTGNNLTAPIITSLIQCILGSASTGLAKGNTTNISKGLSADPYFAGKTAPDANNSAGSAPKAYLTIVFFDERFNYVSENSSAIRVSQAGDGAAPLVLANIKSPKNGYAYVYVSNESNEPVYFDNLTVGDNRGRIIEEDHYYAFGLKIAGISSKKLPDLNGNEGNIDNKNLYNDKELFDEADLDWYDYGFRSYDPQIGRFPQLDPLTDDYPELTPYQYASNEPIANVDMDGLESFNIVSQKVAGVLKVTGSSSFTFIKAAPKVAGKTLSFASKAGIYFKGVRAGINIASNWINHNINPVYLVFNGINSQFTHQDFLDGTPMSHADGVTDAILPFVPVEGILTEVADKVLIKNLPNIIAKKFTKTIIKEAAESASKNPGSLKVLLGKYLNKSKKSYNIVAGKEYTYFQIDDWDELLESVGGNYGEMWKINKQFIDEQVRAGKDFFFSSDPGKATDFFKLEVDYIKEILKVREFKPVAKDLWKAVI